MSTYDLSIGPNVCLVSLEIRRDRSIPNFARIFSCESYEKVFSLIPSRTNVVTKREETSVIVSHGK